MGNEESKCPNCGAHISPGESLCGDCGLNLVTGERYEEKLKRAKSGQKTTDRRSRVGGIGLAIGFGVVILAGFMYQRRVMKALRQRPDRTREYVAAAQAVQRLKARSRMATTTAEREEYRQAAEAVGEDLLEDLETAGQKDGQGSGKDGASGEYDETYTDFVHNLQSKVQYHLSQLEQE